VGAHGVIQDPLRWTRRPGVGSTRPLVHRPSPLRGLPHRRPGHQPGTASQTGARATGSRGRPIHAPELDPFERVRCGIGPSATCSTRRRPVVRTGAPVMTWSGARDRAAVGPRAHDSAPATAGPRRTAGSRATSMRGVIRCPPVVRSAPRSGTREPAPARTLAASAGASDRSGLDPSFDRAGRGLRPRARGPGGGAAPPGGSARGGGSAAGAAVVLPATQIGCVRADAVGDRVRRRRGVPTTRRDRNRGAPRPRPGGPARAAPRPRSASDPPRRRPAMGPLGTPRPVPLQCAGRTGARHDRTIIRGVRAPAPPRRRRRLRGRDAPPRPPRARANGDGPPGAGGAVPGRGTAASTPASAARPASPAPGPR
jgi:hypothetical protein